MSTEIAARKAAERIKELEIQLAEAERRRDGLARMFIDQLPSEEDIEAIQHYLQHGRCSGGAPVLEKERMRQRIAELEASLAAACQAVAPPPFDIDSMARNIVMAIMAAMPSSSSMLPLGTNEIAAILRSDAAPTVSTPRCPNCRTGTSLVLRDFTDGFRLACGNNCGFNIQPSDAYEFALADFAQFFQPVPSPPPELCGAEHPDDFLWCSRKKGHAEQDHKSADGTHWPVASPQGESK